MKAIASDRYGSADLLSLRDVATPSIGDDDVLVEVRAAAVDPGVWIFMTGRPLAARLASGVRSPRNPVLGRALAGVVAAVGARVTRLRPGDHVYGTGESGTFAEFARARERRLARMPANLTFEQAAAVPISAVTALQAIKDARVRANHRVLVIGAGGGVGTFAVQLAKHKEALVTGVCGPSKVQLVRSLGAVDVVDYTQREIDGTGVQYDAIIDTAGNRPLSLLRRASTPDGTIALVGGGHAKGPVLGGFGRQMAAPLISPFGRARLVGVTAGERHTDLDELTTLLESGVITPVVGRTYPLAETADAIRYIEEGHPTGKVVITVRS
ncbi:NADPH:quinone reductase-like Zn-dependent oxidoreductase [Actinoplanes lutulentus]|uniref:NADPH:quinone reductase-like Zn-dependent oxidoreductase n=1 Tax=Actinoplanes lutulentus TaxID=1287878 RepID=A0A327Z8E6_9ACTN|nr:NAD(P)-dependent alcohol dehydrogenase [Actinoplanes lutulentus]MBB2948541.1 NADPH:quinone reductase-like Zn-dependent oxidoreductase [Actinoplanes lutulentus]RAK34427.1 NADPH:quinone reductase-like Zn-dependent oxidoreductase [Actinoplanes lutulentus]